MPTDPRRKLTRSVLNGLISSKARIREFDEEYRLLCAERNRRDNQYIEEQQRVDAEERYPQTTRTF
jgi:hypothetical protein